MMWNPFKRKFRVPIDHCANAVTTAMKSEDRLVPNRHSHDLWAWLENRGAKREWCWETKQNYLVFDSKQDYTMFLLRL